MKKLSRGQLLIEVLFSVVIVSVALVVVSSIGMIALARNRLSVEKLRASRHAQAAAEWLVGINKKFGEAALIDLVMSGSDVEYCLNNLPSIVAPADLLDPLVLASSCGESVIASDQPVKFQRAVRLFLNGGKTGYEVVVSWQGNSGLNEYILGGRL